MGRYWYVPAAIILVLLAAGFLVGWLQLALPPDALGVVQTRRGFDPQVVRPGGFTWRLQRLAPGSLILHRFTVVEHRAAIEVEGSLPSGDVYASLVPERPDFSWRMKLTVLYRARAEALPRLAEEQGLRPEGLVDWTAAQEERIRVEAAAIARGFDSADAGALAKEIVRDLPDRLPDLDIDEVVPEVLEMPDPELYARLKASYLSSLAARESALLKEAGRLASEEADARIAAQRHESTIAVLASYGELLEKYPSLIRFLFLAVAGKLSAQDLQSLDILDRLQPRE